MCQLRLVECHCPLGSIAVVCVYGAEDSLTSRKKYFERARRISSIDPASFVAVINGDEYPVVYELGESLS